MMSYAVSVSQTFLPTTFMQRRKANTQVLIPRLHALARTRSPRVHVSNMLQSSPRLVVVYTTHTKGKRKSKAKASRMDYARTQRITPKREKKSLSRREALARRSGLSPSGIPSYPHERTRQSTTSTNVNQSKKIKKVYKCTCH